MKIFAISATSSLLMALIVGCSGAQSDIQGHFENSSQQQLEAYAGKLAFVPEYEPGQNVMVSSELFNLQGYTMLESIVDAGVNKIYMIPSEDDPSRITPASLRRIAEQDIRSRGIPVDDTVRASLDKVFAKVVVLPRKDPIYLRDGDEVFPTVWARDWAPLTARSPEGHLRVMDLNYYAERQWDDAIPTALFNLLRPVVSNLERVSLPIYNEGGNFMNTPEWCFMTTRVTEANAADSAVFTAEDEARSNNRITRDRVMSNQQLIAEYNRFGCKQTHIFPRLPGEGTGHIDMWTKLLDDHTVMVNDLSDETIATLTPENFAPLSQGRRSFEDMVSELREQQEFLREQQDWFADHGFKVVKVPMPLNLWIFDDIYFEGRVSVLMQRGLTAAQARAQAEYESGMSLTRSYTNSLIANRTVLNPQYLTGVAAKWDLRRNDYRKSRFEYPDKHLLPQYEAQVRKAVEDVGLNIKFIETDDLIAIGGSVHCTTMQTPL